MHKSTYDGGVIVAGDCKKNNDVDMLLLKLDLDGNAQWSKTYGTAQMDTDMLFSKPPTAAIL